MGCGIEHPKAGLGMRARGRSRGDVVAFIAMAIWRFAAVVRWARCERMQMPRSRREKVEAAPVMAPPIL